MKQKPVAPFSFHCVICFDAFDVDHRPPVVLPCGHTYVCEPCSKRLNKCMECRTSLFIKPKTNLYSSQSHVSASPQTRHSRTYGGIMANSRLITPQTSSSSSSLMNPIQKIPLPLPKNLVMISLLEAASKRNRARTDDNNEITKKHDEKEFLNTDDDEIVLDGIDSFASVCGTYVVKERHGLLVQSTNPNLSQDNIFQISVESLGTSSKLTINSICKYISVKGQKNNFQCPQKENFKTDYISNSLVRNHVSLESCYQENLCQSDKIPITAEYEKIIRSSSKSLKRPIVLNYGQRVQVVDFIDGVARLARNRGFIIANRSQLVKVGQPMEKACIIEGMMNSARKTKVDLEKELEKVVRTEKFLVKDLQEILSKPEEHPVVEELKYSNVQQSEEYSDDDFFRISSNTSPQSKKSQKLKSIMEFTSNSSFPVSPSSCSRYHEDDEASVLHDVIFLNSYSHSLTPNTQSSGSCRKSVNAFIKKKSSKFLRRRSMNLGEVDEEVEMKYKDSFNLNPQISCLHKCVVDNNSNITDEAINYRTGLDFRTGLSCHLALNSTRKNGRRVPQLFRNEIRMMGEHRGIASIKPIRKVCGMITSPCLKSKKTW